MAIIELGPHDRMTPEEVLSQVGREAWDRVIVVGYHKDDDVFVVRSSEMSRQDALWIAEHLRLHALDRL